MICLITKRRTNKILYQSQRMIVFYVWETECGESHFLMQIVDHLMNYNFLQYEHYNNQHVFKKQQKLLEKIKVRNKFLVSSKREDVS